MSVVPPCNDWHVYGLEDSVADRARRIPRDKQANRCTDCGACETQCPNGLSIREQLRAVEALA